MKKIDAKAFYLCTSLESVSLPASLLEIGDSAFAECSKLSEVKYAGTTVQFTLIAIYGGNANLKAIYYLSTGA